MRVKGVFFTRRCKGEIRERNIAETEANDVSELELDEKLEPARNSMPTSIASKIPYAHSEYAHKNHSRLQH